MTLPLATNNSARHRRMATSPQVSIDDLNHPFRTARNSKEDSVITQGFQSYDVMVNILCRLPVKSLARFRCVCKQWHSITYDPYFVKVQHERAMARSPGIISRCLKKQTIKSYNFGMADDINTLTEMGEIKCSSFAIEHWELLGYILSNLVNGLACAYDTSKTGRNFYLVNPTIQEYLKLPISCREGLINESIGLGFDESTGEHKLFRLFCRNYNDPCSCEILTVGTHEWRYVGETPCLDAYWEPVFLCGSLYWKAYVEEDGWCHMNILKVDVKNEKFEIISPPETPLGRSSIRGLSGHLSFLVSNNSKPHVRIWMLMDDAKWIEKYSITVESCSNKAGSAVRPNLIGISGDTILLEIPDQLSSTICCQDLHNRTSRKIYDGAYPCLLLHWESLVSPRRLISSQKA